jgi:hypothetical protein
MYTRKIADLFCYMPPRSLATTAVGKVTIKVAAPYAAIFLGLFICPTPGCPSFYPPPFGDAIAVVV